MQVKEAVAEIRAGLRSRSARTWSVRHGRGTAYGWITISAPPSRLGRYDEMHRGDCESLAGLLGLASVHDQGVSIPSGSDYYHEYIDRAYGRTPSVFGKAYWD